MPKTYSFQLYFGFLDHLILKIFSPANHGGRHRAPPPFQNLCIRPWRCYFCDVEPHDYIVSYQLHGFTDASEKAYGCCIYLKCIASKFRVTPFKKKLTIPRLELLENFDFVTFNFDSVNPLVLDVH